VLRLHVSIGYELVITCVWISNMIVTEGKLAIKFHELLSLMLIDSILFPRHLL
jgi:hypothetical protein